MVYKQANHPMNRGVDNSWEKMKRVCDMQETMRKTSAMIMAAKLAKATESPQWLRCLSEAMELIEACPKGQQASLMARLTGN